VGFHLLRTAFSVSIPDPVIVVPGSARAQSLHPAPDLRTRPPPQLSTMSNTTDSVIEKLPNTAELKEDVKAASKSSLQSLRALLAGGVGGVFAVVVGHPFDLVKVRMQTAEKGVYTGAMDVVRKTIAKEGLARGLYAGVSAPLVGVTPMCECP
jgi:hypothetical protein